MIISMIQPHNPTTGKVYQGKNVPILVDCADSFGYSLGQFATFPQWRAAGRSVIKGQKACARLTYFGERETKKADGTTAKGGFASSFCVFAFEQTQPIEGFVPSDEPQDNSEVIEQALDVAPVDKPEYGKQYSLCALSQSGNWKAAEVAPVTPRIICNLSQLAERGNKLEAYAATCYADRNTNTPKRMKQAMNKRLEGDRAKKAAAMIQAAISVIEADPANALAHLTASKLVSYAIDASKFELREVNNGYHSYMVETDKPKYNDSLHRLLRELLDPKATEAAQKEQARILAENELRHSEIPGFFPTPKKVIAHMIEVVGGVDGKIVMDPECGKGDILLASLEAGADCVYGSEISPRLAAYCQEHIKVNHPQFIKVECLDFLERPRPEGKGITEVILMNPPFEKQAAPLHVAHALNWLADGGKLCSVMPSNWEDQKTAQALFERIDQLGLTYETEVLLDGSFAGADSFRQTGVSTCLLIVK